jgi:uncharacterized membrane protein SirB2
VIEFYPEIRLVHIAAVLASGGIFLLRGLAGTAGAGSLPGVLLRYLGYTADTVLLTAALMLMTIVQQYPFVHGWLTVKVVLLLVYLGLGVAAFSVARTSTMRLWLWIAGLAVFGFIYSVARAHHPLGFLACLAA